MVKRVICGYSWWLRIDIFRKDCQDYTQNMYTLAIFKTDLPCMIYWYVVIWAWPFAPTANSITSPVSENGAICKQIYVQVLLLNFNRMGNVLPQNMTFNARRNCFQVERSENSGAEASGEESEGEGWEGSNHLPCLQYLRLTKLKKNNASSSFLVSGNWTYLLFYFSLFGFRYFHRDVILGLNWVSSYRNHHENLSKLALPCGPHLAVSVPVWRARLADS